MTGALRLSTIMGISSIASWLILVPPYLLAIRAGSIWFLPTWFLLALMLGPFVAAAGALILLMRRTSFENEGILGFIVFTVSLPWILILGLTALAELQNA